MPDDNLLTGNPAPAGSEPQPTVDVPESGTQPTDDWRATLPEDIRGDKSLSNFKDVASLAKSYVHNAKLVGGSIRLPARDAKPEEVTALRAKLTEAGVIEAPPAAPDKYTAKLVPPDGVQVDQGQMNAFLAKAHAAGLTDKQAQAVLDFYGEQIGVAQGRLGGSVRDTMATLEKEWGGATQRHLAIAQRALQDADPSGELTKLLDATGLGNHPSMIRLFAKIGRERIEDDPTWSEGLSGDGAETAQTKINAILNNPDDLYHAKHKGKPGHDERVREVARLFEAVAAGSA